MNGGWPLLLQKKIPFKKNWDSGVLGFVPWHLTCKISSSMVAQLPPFPHLFLAFLLFFYSPFLALPTKAIRILCLKIHYRI
jgi:hypothetical protein